MESVNIKEHSQRYALNNEVHARPYQIISSPLRLTHLALLSNDRSRDIKAIGDLCDRFGITRPNSEATFFIAEFPLFKLRWESHTEFSTYTLSQPMASEVAFNESALSKVPEDWVANLPGEVITKLNLELIRTEAGELDLSALSSLFASNTVAGSEVLDGAAMVWTDFQIHADGFNRILIEDRDLRHRQAGRLVQRILEIESYRMLTLMGLPMARRYSLQLATCDTDLAEVTQQVSAMNDDDEEQKLLQELSRIAAIVEHIAATTGYRFSATNAYYGLVKRRISELREERTGGAQTFNEFMERRLAPAVHTCESVSERVQTLSNRVARVSDLIRTRIDVNLKAQNRDLLRSMDRRAALQLRLQEMVEGLSVVVLSYYSVGLLGYLLKGLKNAGVEVNIEIVLSISVPVVLLAVYAGLRISRRKLDKHLRVDSPE